MDNLEKLTRNWFVRTGVLVAALILGFSASQFVPVAIKAVLPDPPHFHGKDISDQDRNTDFALTDSAGQRVSMEAQAGKAVIVTFGYTHCPEACPTTLARLAKARRLLGPDQQQLQVLFVSVDPKRDAGEYFGNFVRTFDPTFIGLRGDDIDIRRAADAFGARYQILELDGEVLIDHSVDSYLVDPSGHVRVLLSYIQTASDIADDVRTVLNSPASCSPWRRWAGKSP